VVTLDRITFLAIDRERLPQVRKLVGPQDHTNSCALKVAIKITLSFGPLATKKLPPFHGAKTKIVVNVSDYWTIGSSGVLQLEIRRHTDAQAIHHPTSARNRIS
jgi:hypothetical protein